MTIDQRLRDLDLALPPLPEPSGAYLLGRERAGILWLAGQGPRQADGELAKGRLGEDLTTEAGYDHARLTGLTVLAAARKMLGSLDRIECIVSLLGIVNATPDFIDHTKVMNGCSELLEQVLGEDGRHPRASIGVASLAQNISVEVVAAFAIR